MSDKMTSLLNMWLPANRPGTFGEVLTGMRITGFRGLTMDEMLEFRSPITILSGLNGSGKSTVLQLASCGFRAASGRFVDRHYIKDYFPVTRCDPTWPFSATAAVEYRYEIPRRGSDGSVVPETRIVTVRRMHSEWSGYKRQPQKNVEYVGTASYLPKVERQDFTFVQGKNVTVAGQVPMSRMVRSQVSSILASAYVQASFIQVKHRNAVADLGIVTRGSANYSENNMGFGEARVLYLVKVLEMAPDRSFFVVEEPETALHEQAQQNLSEYLIDVVKRKRHQLLITTHSRIITQAFPCEAQVLVFRDGNGASLLPQVSAAYVGAVLSSNRRNGLLIAVEDNLAKLLLIEILRSKAPELLRAVEVYSLGNTDDVRTGVDLFKQAGIRAIGVRDADIGSNPSQHLYCLPGSKAPEKELLESAYVQQELQARYGLDVNAFLGIHCDMDHHKWFSAMGGEIQVPEDVLKVEAIRLYVDELPSDACVTVINAVRQELGMAAV